MSLSSALNNAVSGLRASSLAADVVGTNISNALSDSYARRDVVLAPNTQGGVGGVRVTGISRASNGFVNMEWRGANATSNGHKRATQSAARLSDAYGLPSETGSLQARVAAFEASLVSAAARPDINQRLVSVANAAGDVVDKINDVSTSIQAERVRADEQIASAVQQINDLLGDLEVNNGQIASVYQQQDSSPAMFDRRDKLLDDLSELVDFRVFQRDNNTIAIYSVDGVNLLDGSARELEFQPSGVVDANLRVEDGNLSSIAVNGVEIPRDRLSGGSLGALFDIRDVSAVAAQTQIDALALDFAQRLNDPALDPTRIAGDLGLLTDAGTDVDALQASGLGQRLQLNPAIDPDLGGDATRLRDGLLAVTAGPAGNASFLNSLSAALSTPSAILEGDTAGLTMTFASLASEVSAHLTARVTRAEDLLSSAQARRSTLDELRQVNGVDTDAELQKLLLIEQNYGANARVIQTVDELMDTLLGIV